MLKGLKSIIRTAPTVMLAILQGLLFSQVLFAQTPPRTYPVSVDLGVSGITLSYRQSAEEVLGAQLRLLPLDSRRDVLRCRNSVGSEVLELTHYKERWKNSFQQFRVVQAERFKEQAPTAPAVECVLSLAQFRSVRAIQLGMSLSEVTSRLGNQFSVDTQGLVTVITYSIETNLNSEFLRYYDALSYYGRYYFHGGKLIEFSFGIDNL